MSLALMDLLIEGTSKSPKKNSITCWCPSKGLCLEAVRGGEDGVGGDERAPAHHGHAAPAPGPPQQWGTVLSARQLHNQFYRSGKIVTEV